jgi:hypothetical protein
MDYCFNRESIVFYTAGQVSWLVLTVKRLPTGITRSDIMFNSGKWFNSFALKLTVARQPVIYTRFLFSFGVAKNPCCWKISFVKNVDRKYGLNFCNSFK